MDFSAEYAATSFRIIARGPNSWLLTHEAAPRFAAIDFTPAPQSYLETRLIWVEQGPSDITAEIHEAADEAIRHGLCG